MTPAAAPPVERVRPSWRHVQGWPLALRLSLILLVTALLPATVVSWLNLRSSQTQAAVIEHSDLAAQARELARRLSLVIDARRKTVDILGQDRDVIGYLMHTGAQRAAWQTLLDQELASTLRTHTNLSAVFVTDRAGIVVASTLAALRGRDLSAQAEVRQALSGQTQVSDLVFDALGGDVGLNFAAPVQGPAGQVIGVAGLRVRGDAIDTVLAEVEPPVVAFLVNREGIVIAHPDAALRWRSLGPLDVGQVAQLRQAQRLPVDVVKPLGFEGLQPLAGAAKNANSVDFKTPDGARWIAGVASVHDGAWRIYMGAPSARLDPPMHWLWTQALLALAAVLAVVLPAAVLLGRAMSRPILALQDAASRLRSGVATLGPRDDVLAAVGQRRDEIGRLGRLFQSMANEVQRREQHLDEQVRERTRQLEQSHARVDEELRIARAMQQDILPRGFPDGAGFALHGHMQPALEMGGDFFDCFALADGRCGMLVADVSGKGVPAAFFMAVSSTIVQEVARQRVQPAQVLTRANELLCRRNPMELFVTLVYALYDPADGSLSYACAGHSPPLLRGADGQVRALSATPELPLGALPGTVYEEQRITLQDGALLLLFTDGVTEAVAADGQMFGDERLADWMAQLTDPEPRPACEALMQRLAEFVGTAAPMDDITVLLFCKRPLPTAALPRPPWRAQWRIASRLSAIAPLAAQIERVLLGSDLGLAPDAQQKLVFEVNLCIDELLTNTIEYGLQGAASRQLGVALECDGQDLRITLTDDAPAYDPFTEAPEPDLAADIASRPIGGLGVHLVKTFMDEYTAHHDGSGNRIVLRKHMGGTLTPHTPTPSTELRHDPHPDA